MSRLGVEATSRVQFEAQQAGVVPGAEAIAEGVWCVPNPMPRGALKLTSTLCYVIEDADGRLHLIDPGLAGADGLAAISYGLKQFGRSLDEVATVAATHLHPDHLGLAATIRELTGASVLVSAEEQSVLRALSDRDLPSDDTRMDEWHVPADRRAELLALPARGADTARRIVDADLALSAGDELPIAGRRVRVLETPGHTSGSISLVDESCGLVFTGDSVLPHIHPGIGLGGEQRNPIATYLRSLRVLAAFDQYEVCPGHGYRFRGLAARTDAIARHQLRRSRQVAHAIEDGEDASIWGIASRIHWTAGFDQLHGFLLQSALMQTAMHVEFVRSPESQEYLDEHGTRG